MKVGFYPGSFNPWHEGHEDVLNKALKVFDRVIIAVGHNPEKERSSWSTLRDFGERVRVTTYDGLMVDKIVWLTVPGWIPTAVIRGLRNGNDLQYEMNQQYWNEDLGLEIPVVYFITDRTKAHISSSAIRSIQEIQARI